MCFGKNQPDPPTNTPAFAPHQADQWMHVEEETQSGSKKTIQRGIGAPPKGADDNIKGGGTAKEYRRSNDQIRM